jgi:hypothetical protein
VRDKGDSNELPEGLPVPEGDGVVDDLTGKRLPSVALRLTAGNVVDLSALPGVTVAYCFPLMGRPDSEMPHGWDEIPGARGAAPRSLALSAIATPNCALSEPGFTGSVLRTLPFTSR